VYFILIRFGGFNEGLEKATKTKEEGGEGRAEVFWEWCERVTGEFV
jgi:hypothetical protein